MSTQQRWQQIKAIFLSIQKSAPEERATLLSVACGDDEELRQEVESLLAADETSENFLAVPAYEVMAGVLAEEQMEFVAGQEIGPYTILSSLGEGGMGQVYLAQDSRLPRKVALKLLSADVARDERRVHRFEQEAQAASRLNHPNVCMILEIGTAQDGRRFIAMEHIDGLTLRDRIRKSSLSPGKALEVGTQVAAALAAAHAADIVHRDIKPENIMLRLDGFIKVLDFGIAKLSENRSRHGDQLDSTRLKTEPGMFMGTVRYMSPEQLREAQVDQRTDIWSLGVVLYEMLTGLTPFEAPTVNDTIALILDKQQTQLKFADNVPSEFQAVIEKALIKDRARRYQTVKELAADLKKVRRHLPADNDETTELLSQEFLGPASDESTELRRPVDENKATIFVRLKSHATSTADSLIREIKEHKATAVFTGLLAVFAVLLGVPNLPRLSKWINGGSQTQQSSATQELKMSLLTNSGTSVCAAISPDGRSVAHVEKKNDTQQLSLTVSTNGDSVLVPADKVEYRGITFSPDGNYLYFTNTRTEKGESGTLYQVPLPGGSPRRIKDWVDSPIAFSPNGDSFAFVRSDLALGEYSLIVAGTDGTTERVIAKRGKGDRLSLEGPSWSPDGKTIVCGAGSWNKGYRMNLIEVSLDGVERSLGDQTWFSIGQVARLGDGSGLLMTARKEPMGSSGLWRIRYPQVHAEEITTDPADYRGVSASRDTSAIVSVQSQRFTKIWTLPNGDSQKAKAITPVNGLAFGLNWTNNGKIVFSSMVEGHLNISRVDPDGKQTQLTSNGGDNYTPATTPNGRFVVFSSNRTGSFNIWRMNTEDGSDLKQLTFGDADSYPSCSPDGKWVFYDNQSSSKITVWKVSIDGGDAVQLTDEYARMPAVSADNQFIACRYFLENGARRGIAIMSAQGGPPIKLLPIPIVLFQRVQWISNDRALSYIDSTDGYPNIWSYNLDNGAKQQLTHFRDDQIFAYAWSPDNSQLAVERGSEINNIVTIERK